MFARFIFYNYASRKSNEEVRHVIIIDYSWYLLQLTATMVMLVTRVAINIISLHIKCLIFCPILNKLEIS
jgi:hypothetical protein